MSLIHIDNLTKHFKILNRREGLGGTLRDLFPGNYRTVEAVAGISFDKVLLWLPFQAIYHTPLMMITRPDQGWRVFLPMFGAQLLWIVILYFATRLFYNQAVKVLRISGG